MNMAAFEYVVLKPLRIGDRVLEPGEVTTAPNTWSARTQRVYLDGGYLHYGQVLSDVDFEQAPSFTGTPPGYEEREPLEPRQSAASAFEGSKDWRCWNCRKLCFLPGDLGEQVVWTCWGCGQRETIAQVADQQQPTNVTEEMYRRGLTDGDPTDNQQSRHGWTPSMERTCEEHDCIRPLDHSGNHRNAELREWERVPDTRPVPAVLPSGSVDVTDAWRGRR